MSIQSCHSNIDAVLIFYHPLKLSQFSPLLPGCQCEHLKEKMSSCSTSFRNTSGSEINHCVSPSRVSWLCGTLRLLSPACCVCLLEERMKQFSTIISKAQAQVWTNHMQTPTSFSFSLCVSECGCGCGCGFMIQSLSCHFVTMCYL